MECPIYIYKYIFPHQNVQKGKFITPIPKATAVTKPTPSELDNILKELRAVLTKLGVKKDQPTQQTKQTILSAICTVDNNGKITRDNGDVQT